MSRLRSQPGDHPAGVLILFGILFMFLAVGTAAIMLTL